MTTVDLTEPMAIVWALAEADEPIDVEYAICALCGGEAHIGAGVDHESTCPWLRARDYRERMTQSGDAG